MLVPIMSLASVKTENGKSGGHAFILVFCCEVKDQKGPD